MRTYRRPRMLRLETFTTSTSVYGANACTPATKFLIKSRGGIILPPKSNARVSSYRTMPVYSRHSSKMVVYAPGAGSQPSHIHRRGIRSRESFRSPTVGEKWAEVSCRARRRGGTVTLFSGQTANIAGRRVLGPHLWFQCETASFNPAEMGAGPPPGAVVLVCVACPRHAVLSRHATVYW